MPGGPPSIFPLPPGSISAQSVEVHVRLVYHHSPFFRKFFFKNDEERNSIFGFMNEEGG
jgi:hypothetical protein